MTLFMQLSYINGSVLGSYYILLARRPDRI